MYIFLLYIILQCTIKIDMKTAQKIDNNLLYGNVFPFKVRSLGQDG